MSAKERKQKTLVNWSNRNRLKKLVAKQRVKQERADPKSGQEKTRSAEKGCLQTAKSNNMARKKTQLSEFQRLIATFSSEEQKLLREYFQQLDQHILLPKKWKLPMLHDFEQGILYHLQKAVRWRKP